MINDKQIISEAIKHCIEYKEPEMFEGYLLPAEFIFYEQNIINMVSKLIEQSKTATNKDL